MLTVKQVFELARDAAYKQYNFAVKCNSFSRAEQNFKIVREIQDVLEKLDKKDNYIASSNPATETAVLFALNLKESQVQQLKTIQRIQYQVRIIHLTGEEQVLRFPIPAAASSTFELLKYELKVGRIRRASIVKVIPEVGLKQELCHIGEDEEGDDF